MSFCGSFCWTLQWRVPCSWYRWFGVRQTCSYLVTMYGTHVITLYQYAENLDMIWVRDYAELFLSLCQYSDKLDIMGSASAEPICSSLKTLIRLVRWTPRSYVLSLFVPLMPLVVKWAHEGNEKRKSPESWVLEPLPRDKWARLFWVLH
jgi:hypothetical protein